MPVRIPHWQIPENEANVAEFNAAMCDEIQLLAN